MAAFLTILPLPNWLFMYFLQQNASFLTTPKIINDGFNLQRPTSNHNNFSEKKMIKFIISGILLCGSEFLYRGLPGDE